ncbi:hypothetical protein MLD38_007257 [Melastoma candidum]|uniref:Uncharacterized protein n=1 Tax=Melastoma candidum TaxID=119954 RepID=A0ACB9RQ11_9MYRT|nr:hypothetical protein MLD38_007257 [Melastoma candidum]
MAPRGGDKREESVAVAIDNDKASQYAIKWTVENLLSRGQALTLLHIKARATSSLPPSGKTVAISDPSDVQAKDLFLPFRSFCTRKEIQCNEVIMEGTDISRGIVEFVSMNSIEVLVLGAPSRSGLFRFKTSDVPTTVSKGAPDFCTVYVISKGKIASIKSASGPPPPTRSSLSNQLNGQTNYTPNLIEGNRPMHSQSTRGTPKSFGTFSLLELHHFLFVVSFSSPFTRNKGSTNRTYEPSRPDSDISFTSSGRPSIDRLFPSVYDNSEPLRLSNSTTSDLDYKSITSSSFDLTSQQLDFSSGSQESGRLSLSSQNMDDVEAEMRRLRQELKQTIDMYSTACKEALTAKQKAREFDRWKMEEEQRLEEARHAEEAALALAEKEKLKCMAAIQAAEEAQRIAEREAQRRIYAEKKALKEAEERKKILSSLAQNDIRYRKYSIEEIEAATDNFSNSLKIGEGGYGPVYRCCLDHTQVAIKVLRPDANQGRSQFQQEVEVLSCIRHPNMVLLLGACPEYGCLVYEYMANGSLEDRLFRRGGTPVLSWQQRFRIAAEIGTGLLFLHQKKPEPLVHRDLKPGNILLDRNFVSKIGDVGLARLVPPSLANSVTQYRMTSTAGTFCYIDPEYQQTGMLGIKSDIYSLGIMLLQIITAKSPMGLAHTMERAIERGNFVEMLDPAIRDWPVEEALKFAKLALQCAELRRKDRPDLGTVILPELNRLRSLTEDTIPELMQYNTPGMYTHSTTPSGAASGTSQISG